MHPLVAVEQEYLRKKRFSNFSVGDTVEVRVKIQEGDRERVQAFVGTVIARRGGGTREMFTVRRIVQGEGVERIFPVCSPRIVEVKVLRQGHVRRAKLFYLRGRTGKATKVRERVSVAGAEAAGGTQASEAAEETAAHGAPHA